LRILAIGPHPDDVEFGCGGTLARHSAMGDKVYIVHMSRGYHYVVAKHLLVRTEVEGMQEAKRAGLVLTGQEPTILDYPPQYMKCEEDVISALDGLIRTLKIDTVYTVWENDTNQDHREIHHASLAACRNVPDVLCYETPRFMKITMMPFRPQKYVDITSYWDKKLKAMQQYEKIVAYYGEEFLKQVETRAYFRGLECGATMAEAFEIVREVIR